MKLLISILFAVIIILLLEKPLKKYSVCFYCGALIVSVISVFVSDSAYPAWLGSFVTNYLQRGTIATALFIIVMYAILMPKKSIFQRAFMSLRGELAIIAFILILIQNIVYGEYFFVMLFTNISVLKPIQIVAAILSLIMILMLIPLSVTSFKCVRRRMSAKKWKQLQRISYVFYGLLYCHVAILFSQHVITGDVGYTVDLCIYTIIFGGYAVLRIHRYLITKNQKSSKFFLVVGLCIVAACCIGLIVNCVMKNTVSSEPQGKYTDGNYEGEGAGFKGTTKVQVTITNGMIESIEILEYEDDEHFFTQAEETIPKEIIESQSTEVDAVSGATYSSKGIIAAVEDALSQAS